MPLPFQQVQAYSCKPTERQQCHDGHCTRPGHRHRVPASMRARYNQAKEYDRGSTDERAAAARKHQSEPEGVDNRALDPKGCET